MRLKPVGRADFDAIGNSRGIIWWAGDTILDWTMPPDADEWTVMELLRQMGRYVCCGPAPHDHLRAFVAVDLSWHAGLGAIVTQAAASTAGGPRERRETAHMVTHASVPSAIEYARLEAQRLHRWLCSGGTDPVPPAYEVEQPQQPPRTAHALRREIDRLEARRLQTLGTAGQGSKAARGSRVANRQRDGERLAQLRDDLAQLEGTG